MLIFLMKRRSRSRKKRQRSLRKVNKVAKFTTSSSSTPSISSSRHQSIGTFSKQGSFQTNSQQLSCSNQNLNSHNKLQWEPKTSLDSTKRQSNHRSSLWILKRICILLEVNKALWIHLLFFKTSFKRSINWFSSAIMVPSITFKSSQIKERNKPWSSYRAAFTKLKKLLNSFKLMVLRVKRFKAWWLNYRMIF